jgi:predicted MFS family arabinose efflux permease
VTTLSTRSRRAPTLALGLAFVAMFASAPGQSFLIAVFVDDMLEGTGLSRTVFSTLYALATVVSAAISLALGRAADALGLRAAWLGVAAGLACACLLASLAHGLVLAFAGLALLRAFGQGSFPLLGTLVVNYWFPGRRGAAMAVASFGITAGTIALPPLVALLIDGVGWRAAYRILALVILAVVLPLGLLLRRPPAAPRTSDPEQPVPAPDVPMPTAVRRSRRLRVAVPRREAALLLAVLSTPSLVMTALTFHAVSLLGGRGLTATAAAAALSGFGAASAVATVGAGTVADRLSTRTLLVAMSTVLLAGPLLLLAADAPFFAYAGFVAIGLAGGLYGVTGGIAWARTYGVAGLGKLQGMSFAAQISSAAAGPLPLALSLGLTGSYTAGLVFLAVVAAAALAAATRWREPQISAPAA